MPNPRRSAGLLPFIPAPPPQLGHAANAEKLRLMPRFSLFFLRRIKEICTKQRRLFSPVCAIDFTCLFSFALSPLVCFPPLSVFFFSFMCCCSWCQLKGSYGSSTKSSDFGCRRVEKVLNGSDVGGSGISQGAVSLQLLSSPSAQSCPKMT